MVVFVEGRESQEKLLQQTKNQEQLNSSRCDIGALSPNLIYNLDSRHHYVYPLPPRTYTTNCSHYKGIILMTVLDKTGHDFAHSREVSPTTPR